MVFFGLGSVWDFFMLFFIFKSVVLFVEFSFDFEDVYLGIFVSLAREVFFIVVIFLLVFCLLGIVFNFCKLFFVEFNF